MPELPELEVVREVLQRRVVGEKIAETQVLPPGGPIVVRDLTGRGFASVLTGRTISGVNRRGKFLVLELHDSQPILYLAINPKLSGRLQLAEAAAKRLPKTLLIFTLGNGKQLRYVDQKQMGQLYLTEKLGLVPEYASLGPEALEISFEDFRARVRPFRGEIKGVLTRGEFVAGIGNAYADEILWAAQIHPFRKRTQLSAEELKRLYDAMRKTLLDAIQRVRLLMGENIHLEPREFMAVHMKAGEPCPRCGAPISVIGANQRITNFCRHCQPGGLIKGL
jgi:formamidopyrimidine-DNA glycosylase